MNYEELLEKRKRYRRIENIKGIALMFAPIAIIAVGAGLAYLMRWLFTS